MFEQACLLSGWDPGSMLEIITEGGVDLNDASLIEKQSLWEFQEALALALHWDEWNPLRARRGVAHFVKSC